MGAFVPWNSQPLEEWAERFAVGETIDLGGHRTHYVVRGSGDPVVLIHGFNLDLHTWMRNLDSLAARFTVYAPDLWGQGYSTRAPLDYGFDLFERQVRLFMDAVGLEQASLVGHSMGGGTAAHFALRNRDRVQKLVLLDSVGIPAPLPLRAKFFRLRGVAELLMSLPTDRVRLMNLKDIWIHNHDALTEPVFKQLTNYQKVAGTTEALLTMLRRDFFHTLEDEYRQLGQLQIPTLIIWGRGDPSVPVSSGETIQRLMPGSWLEILEDAGHLANFDQAESFNRLVIDFLTKR